MQCSYPLSPQLPTPSLVQPSPTTTLFVFSCFSAETAEQWGCSKYGLLSSKVDWWLFSIDY